MRVRARRALSRLLAVAWLALGLALPARAEPSSMGEAARATERVLVSATAGGTTLRAVGAGEMVGAIGGVGGGAPRVVVGAGAGDPERVVIRLRGIPLARARAAGLLASPQALASQRLRAGAAILAAASRARGRTLARKEVITREYAQVFHGFAARLPAAAQAEVRQLPDVAGVHPDVEVHTTLAESVPLVEAPAFWAEHAYRGAGAVIAIIDTGVDYTHPDLGGCFGPGCKVLGGFDFVNDDGDPLDDAGHGTHVASIAAGAGSAPGVAPDASLLAYKVCSSFGQCFTSDVVAGIERAVDPDEDLDTSDHADVINLSLGGPGDADDPMSQAVDGASAAGVLVAVAAGNAGPGFLTVGSPGTARTALTVGATTKSDESIYFSSRGPSPLTYDVKPEIVAPGVSICAARAAGTGVPGTCADDAHISLSGTSMATPHVAGAAALVRGLRPALAPDEAKALLVENSRDLGLGLMIQGAGRLDVRAAAAARTVVTPAAVSFGLDDLTLATWTAGATLTVRNLDTSPRAYTLGATSLVSGITVTLTPSTFTLAPGAAQAVAFDLAVDNTSVPNLPPPHTYEGNVLVDSGSNGDAERQRVPFAFVKQSRLRVHFDPDFLPILIVHDGTAVVVGRLLPADATTHEVLLPDGVYDVILKYAGPAAVVVHPGVVLNGFAEETFPRSEATHTVEVHVRDENDVEFVPDGVVFTLSRGGQLLFYAGGPTSSYGFSDVSSAYEVDVAAHAQAGSTTYFVADFVRGGISGDWLLGNRGSELVRGDLSYHPPPGEPSALLFPFLMFMGPTESFGFNAGDVRPLPHQAYFNVPRGAGGALFFRPWMVDANFPAVSRDFAQGPFLHGGVAPGTIDGYALFEPSVPVYTTSTGELPINLGPPFWFDRLHVDSPASIRLAPPTGHQCMAFRDQGGDGPQDVGVRVPWELRSAGVPIRLGTLPQTAGGCTVSDGTQVIDGLVPGPYDFVVDAPPYFVGETAGTTRLEASFDTTRGDPTPPFMSHLTLRSGGKLTAVAPAGAPLAVRVQVEDAGGVATVEIAYGTSGQMVTVPAAEVAAGVYETVIAACEPGPVVLTVTATDGAGNTLRQHLDPGFLCVVPDCGDGVVTAGEECDDGNLEDGDGCNAVCRHAHDAVVRQPRPLGVTIPTGAAEVRRRLSLRVRNADRGHRDTIELVASDGTCPPGTVAGLPDFRPPNPPADSTASLGAGQYQTARVPLVISSAAFTSTGPKAPQRCILRFTASTVLAGNTDPTPTNSVALVELNVVDLNDTVAAPFHQALITSLRPQRGEIARGSTTALVPLLLVRVRHADRFDPFVQPFTVLASDGDCPAGTVGVVDFDPRTPGPQNVAVMPGDAIRQGVLPLAIRSAAFATPSRRSPARCTAVLRVTGPGGDVDASNDATQLIIDVSDANDR